MPAPLLQVALRTVEAPHRRARGEAFDLALPVAEQGRRADHEGGTGVCTAQMEGDEGDGLAQPHVVGEAAAQTERRHGLQPRQAAQLVVAQRRLKAGRRVCGGEVGGDPVAQPGQRPFGHDLDVFAVHLGLAGQHHGEGVGRVEQTEVPFARLADELRVDEHPLVPQPHQRTVGLGERVHLSLGERFAAHRELPAELQEAAGGEEAEAVGGRAGRPAAHDRCRRQLAGEAARPVHVDVGFAQPAPAPAEQIVQLRDGQRQHVGHLLVQQPGQRRPRAGGGAQHEDGVDVGRGPNAAVSSASDHSRAASATRALSARLCTCTTAAARAGRVVRAAGRVVGLVVGSRRSRRFSHVGRTGPARPGPAAARRGPRHPRRRRLRPPTGGRAGVAVGCGRRRPRRPRARRPRCGAGCRRARRGRPAPAAPVPGTRTARTVRTGDGYRVCLGGHRGGHGAQVCDVLTVQGPGPPHGGVVLGEPGQQPAARDELQAVQRRGAPARGGRVGVWFAPGTHQQRHGGGEWEHEGGHGLFAHTLAVPLQHGQLLGRPRAPRRPPPSGRQKATRPARGGFAGRKTAAQRARARTHPAAPARRTPVRRILGAW